MPSVIRKCDDGWVVVDKASGKRRSKTLSKRKAKIVASLMNQEG